MEGKISPTLKNKFMYSVNIGTEPGPIFGPPFWTPSGPFPGAPF